MKLTSDLLLAMEHLVEGINDPYIFKAVFLAGGPGSGKSWVGGQMFSGLGVKFSNSDDILRFLAGKEVRWDKKALSAWLDMRQEDPSKMLTRDHAKSLMNAQKAHWMNSMLGLVVDGTARDYGHVSKLKHFLEAAGYDTSMVFVNTSLEVAIQRNLARERKVREDIVRKAWEAVQGNMGKFQGLFGAGKFLIVDNSSSVKTEAPPDVSSRARLTPANSKLMDKEAQAVGSMLRRKAMKLLGQPLENPIGQAIVASLRATGGKVISDLARGG